jgi:DNA-binding CsgD family transcriptional regulator
VDSQGRACDADAAHAEASLDPARIFVSALNALSAGIALLDPRGLVLFANAAATRMLKQHGLFKACPALQIAPSSFESNAALRRAIVGTASGDSTALHMRDREGKTVISAVVLPLRASADWDRRWQAPNVLLAINELVRSRAIPEHWLSQMFGLTRAEASVANWLVSGRTIDEYAQHRGVSLETARSQLKAVLSKTGISKQAQLVAALSRLPIEYEST